MEVRISRMIEQAGRAPTELLQYNKLRSSNPDCWIFSVEGKNDISFYQTVHQRVGATYEYKFLVCGGKQKVLNLNDLLKSSISAAGKDLVKFFVDNDFDGLKDSQKTQLVYCTPTYSIENILVSESILKNLLVSRFKCVGDDDENINHILSIYRQRLSEFNNAIKSVNLQLFFARRKGISGTGIKKNLLNKFLSIELNGVHTKSSCTESIESLLGFDEGSIPVCAELETEFDSLDPCMQWRGKFHYEFFLRFIELLAKDASSDASTLFGTKRKVNFKSGEDHIQDLALHAELPACLSKFLRESL